MTSKPFQVAIIQAPPVFLNLKESVARAGALIQEAAETGARIIVFPETWLPGYPVWLDHAPKAALWDHVPAQALYRLLVENALELGDQHLAKLRKAAGQTKTTVVMGAHERLGGALYNTIFYLHSDGETLDLHRKLMPTYTERLIWGRGDGSTMPVLETGHGRLGGLICWEHWMPLARAAMHAKGELVHVAQWPAVKELHQIASRHYAFEGQCFVLAAGCVLSRQEILDGFYSLEQAGNPAGELLASIPTETDLLLTGGSAIIGPDSNYLAGPLFNETGIISAEIDPGRVVEGHLVMDTAGHYSRPDVFRLTVDQRPQIGVSFEG